uniref:7TM_GPCR_Srx domain-containing protein n=1 Tax=Steinernema glaseri TaxID=37863 RepID=A0A1I7YJV3_9BILA
MANVEGDHYFLPNDTVNYEAYYQTYAYDYLEDCDELLMQYPRGPPPGGSFINNSFVDERENHLEQHCSDVYVALTIVVMSLMAIISNLLVIKNSRRTKIFGRFFGFLFMYRSFFESISALFCLCFFASYIYFAYEVPTVVNVVLATTFTFTLSSTYVLHLITSANRCFAVFLPMRYDGVFEKKRSVWICIVIVPCVACVIASIPSFPFNHTCGQFLFSRVRYDIMPKGCEDWEPGYPEMQSQTYATIITWAVLTFSALATDVLTMIRLIFLA